MTKLHDDVVQKVDFTRTATKDAVSGEVTYGAWSPAKGKFDKYDVPQITGYTATPTEVPAEDVDPDNTKDSTVNVIYTAIGSKIVINFIDTQKGNSVVDSKTFTGKFGENVALDFSDYSTKLAGKGYVIGESNAPKTDTYKATTTTYTVNLTHATIAINKDNAEANGVTGLTREIKRTITFNTQG